MATPNNKRPKRPMPHVRQGNESFLYRSAISLVDVSTSAPSQRKGTLSDFSSLGTVDENNQVISSITSSIKSAAAGGRATALKLLHQAASVGIITNDLKPRRDTLDGMDEDLGDVILSEEGEEDDDEEENNKEERRISRLSRSTKSINTEHKRNCGQHTIIAFVNSASGGGMGTTLYKSLQSHLGSEFVFDLHSCSPGNMPEDTLLEYAYDPNVRVLACGGDGTSGWIFSSLDNVWSIVLQTSSNRRVHLSQYEDHLPLAIIPLGTGNDLSRQFGWGGSFKSRMNDKSMIASVSESKVSTLDRWRCIIMPVNTLAEDEKEYIPQILSENYHDIYPSGEGEGEEEEIEEEYPRRSTLATVELLQSLMHDDDDKESKSTTKSSPRRKKNQQLLSTASSLSAQVFDGVFCNYFSLGFDAAIAYLFHHDREQHPEKFTSPLKNKIIYASKAPYAFRAPKLSKRVKILVNNDKGELVKLKIPKSTRAIVSILFC